MHIKKDNIKLIVSDFDGIFTDGSVFINDNFSNFEIKSFKQISFQDIMGVSIILKRGINFVIISGEKTGAIDYLKNKFPSIEVYQNIRNKFSVLKEVIKERDISLEEVLYIGDDINDIECLENVGVKFTVPNSNYKVKEITDINITRNKGGNGAFREIIDYLIDEK